jgi:hypothetical protein
VTVTVSYYVRPSGRTATFDLYDSHKNKLSQLSGSVRGMEPTRLRGTSPAVGPGYPTYEVITVNGMVEVIEHRRMEPVFYVTDDPAVWNELAVSASGRSGDR